MIKIIDIDQAVEAIYNDIILTCSCDSGYLSCDKQSIRTALESLTDTHPSEREVLEGYFKWKSGIDYVSSHEIEIIDRYLADKQSK